MARLFSNVILVMYLRLMQIIMIAILVILCCPLLMLCNFFRRGNQPRKADDYIIKNLNKISIEDFHAYKRYLKRKKKESYTINDDDSSMKSIISDSDKVEDLLELTEESEEHLCSICLDDFKEGCEVVLLPCRNHTFHFECIEKWLKQNSLCPECRF